MAHSSSPNTNLGSTRVGSKRRIVTWIVLLIGAVLLLILTESQTAGTPAVVKSAQETAIHVDNISTISPSLNRQLIHATAMAQTPDTLRDEMFGIAVAAIKLTRKVEYYQWQEQNNPDSDEETASSYSYHTNWTDAPVNSSTFKNPAYRNSNFVIAEIENCALLAENITLGAYILPQFLKDSISGEEPIELASHCTQPGSLTSKLRVDPSDYSVESPANLITVSGDTVYLGKNAGNPQVGDVRVTFKAVTSPTQMSVIAKVNGNTFEPFIASNGESFSQLTIGAASINEMLQQASGGNSATAWALRIAALLTALCGFALCFNISVSKPRIK
ncbi:MAG: TMEM43 family protein [Muribaculaceae bacterium]